MEQQADTLILSPSTISCSLWQLVRYFFRLGTPGFGGPVALVGSMHRDLVEKQKWIAETDYPGRVSSCSTLFWSPRGSTGDVSRLCAGADSGGNPGGAGLYLALVSDGSGSWLALHPLWWFALNASCVLRSGC